MAYLDPLESGVVIRVGGLALRLVVLGCNSEYNKQMRVGNNSKRVSDIEPQSIGSVLVIGPQGIIRASSDWLFLERKIVVQAGFMTETD
jgi:hypothetical protein